MAVEEFMLRVLAVATALGPACGLLGAFVTARRMAFFSDTVAHAALAGVAVGFVFGITDPTLPMLAFCLLVAFAILWLKENTQLLSDTIMALLLTGSVAFGVTVITLLKGFRQDLDRVLFGDILSVGWNDVAWAASISVALIVILLWKLNPLTLMTVSEDLAHVSGISVPRANRLFVAAITLVVALSIRLLGIILVTSLLVIPSAAARNLSRNLRQQLSLSLALGLVGAVGGVLASYPLNIPSGPAITLTLVALFLATLALRRFRPTSSLHPHSHSHSHEPS